MRIFTFLGALALCLLVATGALAEKRVALVIGNFHYPSGGDLKNPGADADLMAQTLRAAGFSSVDERTNLNRDDLLTALQKFAAQARTADVAVLYYAGHGMEVGGVNYLLPVDAKLADEADVKFETVPLATVLDTVKASRLNLIILDACRNNPFAARMRRTDGTRAPASAGLASVEPEGDTLVLYAAKDGTPAIDGVGANANSPFAKALAARLAAPGLELGLALRQVRDDVLVATKQRQMPFTYGSLGGAPFYFVPGPAPVIAAAGPDPAPAPAGNPFETSDKAEVQAAELAYRNGQAGLAPHIEKLREILNHAPSRFPEVEIRGDVVLIRSDAAEFETLAAPYRVRGFKPVSEFNTYVWAAYLLSRSASGQGRFDEAVAYLDRGLRLTPDNYALLAERGSVLSRANRPSDSLASYETVLRSPSLTGGQRALSLNGKGTALLQLRRINEAQQAFEDALKLDPSNATAQIGLQAVAASRPKK